MTLEVVSAFSNFSGLICSKEATVERRRKERKRGKARRGEERRGKERGEEENVDREK